MARRMLARLGLGVAVGLVAMAGVAGIGVTAAVAACERTQVYQPLAGESTHHLDWQVLVSRPSQAMPQTGMLLDAGGCARPPVDALRAIVSDALGRGAVVVLGEVHDNPHHHHVRAWLLPMRAGNAPPAVILEHIRADQQAAVDAVLARPAGERTATALLDALAWSTSGWPDAAIFAPLFERMLAGGHAIVAGNPARDGLRAVARGGPDALDAAERRRLGLEAPLPTPLAQALLAELEASHCNLVPASAFGAMAAAQRYRDAFMAAATLAAAEAHGSAVLLTGNGHVRTDRGVPFDLARLAPGREVLAIMLVETRPGETDANAYVPRDPSGAPAADALLFAPRVERKDPCIAMREQFKQR